MSQRGCYEPALPIIGQLVERGHRVIGVTQAPQACLLPWDIEVVGDRFLPPLAGLPAAAPGPRARGNNATVARLPVGDRPLQLSDGTWLGWSRFPSMRSTRQRLQSFGRARCRPEPERGQTLGRGPRAVAPGPGRAQPRARQPVLHEDSGGQRQRIGVARALAVDPPTGTDRLRSRACRSPGATRLEPPTASSSAGPGCNRSTTWFDGRYFDGSARKRLILRSIGTDSGLVQPLYQREGNQSRHSDGAAPY